MAGYILAAGLCCALMGVILLRWGVSILSRHPTLPSDFRIPLGLVQVAAGLFAAFYATGCPLLAT